MTRLPAILFCLALVLAGGPARAAESPVAPGAHLVKAATGFAFTEGPTCDRRGDVYFTDQPNDRILKWDTDGSLTTYMHPCGHANGLCFDARGSLWACADGHNQLWRIDPSGRVADVVNGYGGKLLDGPNDVWLRPDGGLYFTDPYYARAYWTRGPAEQDCQGVYYLSPDRRTLTRVISDLQTPNGIIGTPDGKTLYIGDLAGGRTYAYRIHPDGSLSDKRLFCPLGSDGMTIDSDGDVYLTGHGVTVFDRDGTQVLHIPVPENWTGNLCFGGRDRRTLFITASTGIYTLRMRVHGVGSQ